MAYGNYLASVGPGQVHLLRQDVTHKLATRKIVIITHLTAYWVKRQPLGTLLGQAIDGGEVLSSKLWHPLRAPTYHQPSETLVIFKAVSAAWHDALAGEPFRERDWFRDDIERLLAVFECAVQANEGVVSVLEPPFDAERASRVSIPFTVPPNGQ